jgi:hypothetical protein
MGTTVHSLIPLSRERFTAWCQPVAVRAVSVGTIPGASVNAGITGKLCEYGGGSHAVVAAPFLSKPDELDRRACRGEIAGKLQNDLR